MPDTLRLGVFDSKGRTRDPGRMTTNDRPVTTTAEHVSETLNYLDAAKAYRYALQDAYSDRPQDRARIADLHQAIGYGLKVAEIHALLAIAVSRPDEPIPFTLAADHEIETDACTGCVGLDHVHECEGV